MSPGEKALRHAKLYKVVTTHTSHSWAAVLAKMLLEQMGVQGMARQTPYIPKELLEGLYHSAKKRLFLFDYDVSRLLFSLRCDRCLTVFYVLGYFGTHRQDSIDGDAL